MSVSLINFNNISNSTINNVWEIKNVLKDSNKINNDYKTIIYMNGVAGSGKSLICKKIKDYFKFNNKKCYVLSNDDFRYNEKGYVYEKEYEKIVLQKYTTKLKELVSDNKYKFIILDNTHINYDRILNTRECYKNNKVNEFIISIEPFKDITKHINLNIHKVPEAGIKKQIEEWKKHRDNINGMKIKTLFLNRENDIFIQENQINILCNIINYLFV